MKNFIPIIIALLFCTSCGPTAYLFSVDLKQNAIKDGVVKSDDRVAVITTNKSESKLDSLYCSNLALGIASGMEKDRSLGGGFIPVYVVKDSMDYFAQNINVDKIFNVESVVLGAPNAKILNSKNDIFTTSIQIPFNAEFSLIDAKSGKVGNSHIERDTVYIQVLSKQVLTGSVVKSKIVELTPAALKMAGAQIASYFSPQWTVSQFPIVVYEDSNSWVKAYDYATDFKWKEAITIWMAESKSKNVKRASYAAYNLAVAFEIVGKREFAVKWIDISEKLYAFKESRSFKYSLESSK